VCAGGASCDLVTGACVVRSNNCSDPVKTWTGIVTPSLNTQEELPGSFTAEQCCIECWNSPGCTYWYQFSFRPDSCFIATQGGATEANQCPAGNQSIQYSDGQPSWNTGPCGTPDH
jgi:hypothetical protein